MLLDKIKNKRIVISPLNWGMGHVARCIPLIAILLKNKNSIIVACDKDQELIFKQYFPDLEFIFHSGYPFKFGKRGNFGLDLAKQFGLLRKRMNLELVEVESFVEKYAIDVIISDHRYGFRSEKAHSIIMTHQLNLPVKWYESWVQKVHTNYLSAFDEIWVPDTENSDYSGDLSKNKSAFKVSYLGALSRFSLYDQRIEKDIDQVVIVSGPTVYAQLFLEEQIKLNSAANKKVHFIVPKEVAIGIQSDLIQIQTSIDWRVCDDLIRRSKKIISRSAYSTLMDLIVLKTPFSITPTPGQREQEYLFDLWYKKAFGDTASLIENKE